MVDIETIKSGEEVTIRILLDYSKISIQKIEEFELEIEQTVFKLGEGAKGLWANNAELQLKSSNNYIDAINNGVKYPYNDSRKSYAIMPKFKQLSDGKDLGIVLEYGYEPFDMKEKFLKGADKKVVKFEYGVPGSKHRMELPKDIYQIAVKHKMFSQYSLTPSREPSIFEKNIPASNWQAHMYPTSTANKINPNKLKAFTILKPNRISQDNDFHVKYAWQNRQFKGLKQTGVNVLSVFRTISKKSAADSWINPGQVPKYIFKNMVEMIIPKIRTDFEKLLTQYL